MSACVCRKIKQPSYESAWGSLQFNSCCLFDLFYFKSSCAIVNELFQHFSPKCVFKRKSRRDLKAENSKTTGGDDEGIQICWTSTLNWSEKTQGKRIKEVKLQHLLYKFKQDNRDRLMFKCTGGESTSKCARLHFTLCWRKSGTLDMKGWELSSVLHRCQKMAPCSLILICTKSQWGLFWVETRPPSNLHGNTFSSFGVILLTNQQTTYKTKN